MITRYAIIFALIALSSCKPTQIITERITSDTTIIKEVERIVTIEGQSVQSPSVNLDSLVAKVRAGIPVSEINRTLYTQDPETKMRVGLLIDQLGNLTALCETQDQMIQVMDKEIQRLQKESVTVVEKPSFWDKVGWGLIGMALGMVLSFVATVFIRR